MKVAIIKYNAGNVYSVDCALRRIGVEPIVTADEKVLKTADKVIFPGVGEASTAMQYLRETNLDAVIKQLSQPVLGICIGLQLLCRHSQEGNADCLGIFDIDVKKFETTSNELKIPHMGWNVIEQCANNKIITTDINNEFVYFVHSYYAPISKYTIAKCNYIHDFSAAIHKDNFFATQFHPEKSGKIGELILKNFIEL